MDDDRLLRGMGAAAWQRAGYHVLTAPAGPAGVALAQREHPDLILLDGVMPSRYGVEYARSCEATRRSLSRPSSS
jgi:DNA-binding response OmpR family regulator